MTWPPLFCCPQPRSIIWIHQQVCLCSLLNAPQTVPINRRTFQECCLFGWDKGRMARLYHALHMGRVCFCFLLQNAFSRSSKHFHANRQCLNSPCRRYSFSLISLIAFALPPELCCCSGCNPSYYERFIKFFLMRRSTQTPLRDCTARATSTRTRSAASVRAFSSIPSELVFYSLTQ